jgi:NADH-quinone oxidoreductase subunit H
VISPFLWTAVKVALALGFGLNVAGFLGWVERKQSAVMQDRIGANRASILGFRVIGLFHPIADAIKMMTKSDFVPEAGNGVFHALAPAISLGCSMLCLAALPFGDRIELGGRFLSLQPLEMTAGAVFVLAMLSVGVHGIVMAGYASGSNYALLGGLRGAAQMIAYEVTLALTFLGALFIYGTLNLQEAVRWQGRLLGGWLPAWGIFLQPLGFILFLTAAAAETKRIPFDLPEGESEIVGYFVEYSGMRFGMFLMNDLIESIVLSGFAAALFLGGWQIPWMQAAGTIPVAMLQVAAFCLKVAAVLFLLMQVRWTLPRFRFDQVLDLGWKGLLPLSIANLLVTVWAVYLWS